MSMIRQGDVLLIPIEKPEGPVHRVCDADGRPLQGLRIEGERTGHAHELPARVYDTEAGARVLFLERPGVMRHAKPDGSQADHAPVDVPAGWWTPIQQREYVPASRPRSRAWAD